MIEVDFKDRVPTHAGRIKLTPVSGQTDTFDMVRADEPTVEGTPIDKATFESIIQSRLTGRYYQASVTKKATSSQSLTINPIPTSGWVLDTTKLKGTSGAYTVEASSFYASGYTPEKALDGDMDTEYRSDSGGATFKLTFPAPIKIKKYKIAMRADNYTQAVTTEFQGSTNGTTWTTLFTTTEKPDDLTEYTLTSTGEYSQYRLNFTANSTGVNIYQFSISEYEVSTYGNEYSIASGVPVVWHTGQIILIQTPTNADGLAVTSNKLNGVTVNAILQPSKRYELTYNGTSFNAKEV